MSFAPTSFTLKALSEDGLRFTLAVTGAPASHSRPSVDEWAATLKELECPFLGIVAPLELAVQPWAEGSVEVPGRRTEDLAVLRRLLEFRCPQLVLPPVRAAVPGRGGEGEVRLFLSALSGVPEAVAYCPLAWALLTLEEGGALDAARRQANMVAFSLAGAANEAMQAARAKAAERAAAKAAAAKAAAKARKSKGKQALQLFSRTVSLLAPREAPAALAPAPQDPVEKIVEECRSTAAALRQWAEQCGPQLQRAATSATTTTISGLPEPLQQALNGSVHAIALQADAVAAAARLEASYLDAIAGRGAAALEMDDLVAQECFGAAKAEWVGVVRSRRESLCRWYEASYQREAAQRLAPII
eukprot:gene12657-biopygen9299